MAAGSIRQLAVDRWRVVACIGGLALILTGCASAQSVVSGGQMPADPPALPGRTRHVVAGPFELDAPAAWHVGPPLYLPSGSATLAFLSPQPLRSPCQETAFGGTCHGWPFMQLDPGSVVVAIREFGAPRSTPPEGGAPVSVAGRAAREFTGPADKGCSEIGGSESTSIVLPDGVPGNSGWLSIAACLAGPNTSAAEAAFDAIVTSVSFTDDPASP